MFAKQVLPDIVGYVLQNLNHARFPSVVLFPHSHQFQNALTHAIPRFLQPAAKNQQEKIYTSHHKAHFFSAKDLRSFAYFRSRSEIEVTLFCRYCTISLNKNANAEAET